MAEEENNKTIIAEIGKNISSAIGTFKKSILKISGAQDKSATKFIKTAGDLVDENKSSNKSFSKDLISIKNAIIQSFPKIIQNIKTTLAPSPASEPSAGVEIPKVKVIVDTPVAGAPGATGAEGAPSKDDTPSWMEKMDGPAGILGLFGIGMEKKETKDSTPEVIKESNTTIVETLKERFSTLSSVVSTLAGAPAPTPEGAPRTEATIPPAPVAAAADAPDAAGADSTTSTTIESTSKTIVETLKEKFTNQLTSLNSIVTAITGAPAPPAPTPEGTPRTEATAPSAPTPVTDTPEVNVTVDAPTPVAGVAGAPGAAGAESTETTIESTSKTIVETLKEKFSTQLTSLNSIVSAITGAPAPPAPTPEGIPRTEATAAPVNVTVDAPGTDSTTSTTIESTSKTIVETLKEKFTNQLTSLNSIVSAITGTPAPTPEGAPRTEATAPPVNVTVDAPGAAGAESTETTIETTSKTIVETLKEKFSNQLTSLNSIVSAISGTPAPTPEGAPRTEATAPPVNVTVDAPAGAVSTETTIETTSKTIVETLKENFNNQLNSLKSITTAITGAPASTPEGAPRTEATAPPVNVTVDAPADADGAPGTPAPTSEGIPRTEATVVPGADSETSTTIESTSKSIIETLKENSTKVFNTLETGYNKTFDWLEKVDESSEKESETSSQSIVGRLKENASTTINSLSSVFTKQSDDVEGSIKEQTDVAQDMAAADEEGKATEQVLAVEEGREKATADSEQMQILRDIRDSLKGSFGAVQKDRKKGGFLAGLLGGIGAGIGAIAKGVAKIGVGFGKGMIALGVGIAGFILALGAAGVILNLMGADGKALKTIIQTFFGAFDAKSAAMMGGLIAIAGIMAKLKIGAKQMAFGMASLGAGIGAFFLAIGAASWIAESAGLNGDALAGLIQMFFGAFDAKAAVMMGGIVAIAATVAKLNVNPLKLSAGMTAIGMGLAGFFGGIILADFISDIAAAQGIDGGALKKLMDNFFGIFDDEAKMATLAAVIGVGALVGIVGDKKAALKVFAGMTAIGMGLAGFFGGIILADAGASIAAGIGGGIDGSSLKTLMNNFFGIFDSKSKVATLSAVLGVGALTGIVGGAKAAVGIFAGMTAMGAGLAGFFGGILMADWLANIGKAEGVDGSSLSTLIKNFVDAFSSSGKTGVALLASILGVGAIVGIVGAVAPGVGAAVIAGGIFAGMTALGAGLVGFFGGIMLADKLTEIFGVDGSGIAKLITNFLGAFKSKKDIATLAVLLAAGGAASFNPLGVAAGMTAIGAGIVGFFGAFAGGGKIAEWLGIDMEKVKIFMTNVGEGIGGFIGGMAAGTLDQLQHLDAKKMEELGQGIAGIGIGIAAFAGAKILGSISGVMAGLTSFFGVDSPIDQILELASRTDIDTDRLKALGEGIEPLGKGLAAFSGLDLSGGAGFMKAMIGKGDAFGDFFRAIAKLGKLEGDDIPDPKKLEILGKAIEPLGLAMANFSGVNMSDIMGTSWIPGKDSALEAFFKAISGKNLDTLGSKDQIKNVADGITPLGKALQEFSGIDMADIVGNKWVPGEPTSFESFLKGVAKASTDIKDPKKLHAIAAGLSVLGGGMHAFKGLEPHKMNFSQFFNSLNNFKPEKLGGGDALRDVAGGIEELGKAMQSFKGLDASKMDYEKFFDSLGEGDPDKWKERLDVLTGFTGGKGAEPFLAIPAQSFHTGGIVPKDGPINALGGEFILDQQAAQVFMKAATLLTQSQALEQSRAGGGPPVIINQVDNSQSNPVISNQTTAIKAPDSPHPSESTKMMLDQAYAMG